MSNKNFQPEENEILSRDDEKIRQMLGNLERIDAPKDFDFRLKARIANAKPEDFRPRLFPILRYAAPLGLAIIVLAVVVINGLYSFDNNSVASVNSEIAKPLTENIGLPDSSQPGNLVATNNLRTTNTENPSANVENNEKNEIKPFQKNLEFVSNTRKPKNDTPKTANNNPGSFDRAGTSPNVFLPPGFDSNNTYSVKDILSMNGIDASFADKKWTVKSVFQNSSAERVGIKVNDVIEAINEKKISTETITSNEINVKKLTVVRGGEKIEINLQKK